MRQAGLACAVAIGGVSAAVHDAARDGAQAARGPEAVLGAHQKRPVALQLKALEDDVSARTPQRPGRQVELAQKSMAPGGGSGRQLHRGSVLGEEREGVLPQKLLDMVNKTDGSLYLLPQLDTKQKFGQIKRDTANKPTTISKLFWATLIG